MPTKYSTVDEAMSKNWDATHKKDADIRHTKAPMKDYKRPGTPSKEEMRAVVKAYRLVKDETDFDELERVYNTIKK